MGDEDENDNGEVVTTLTSTQIDTMSAIVSSPWDGINCEAFPEFDKWNEDGEEDEEDQNEANEICQNVMEVESVSLDTCGYDNEAEEEEEAEAEANDYNFYYEFQMDQDTADEIQSVCTFYNAFDFKEYEEIYEGETHFKPQNSSSGGLMSGSKAGIAIIVHAIVGGLAFMANKKSKKQDSKLV